jgi:SAM-dependent methyltransferase
MAHDDLHSLLNGLKAVAEPSRLRLFAICTHGEWTVSELVQVMGMSQPRISRHLKLLAEAGLLERFREGSWVFYRQSGKGAAARIATSLGRLLPAHDPVLTLDRQRLDEVRAARRRQAERFFDTRAAAWDAEHDLAVDGALVERELLRLFAGDRVVSLLDIGTGTGRVLQLLASRIGSGLGVDISREMLAVARANLDRRGARHCQVRQGDMYRLPLPDASFAAVTLHQVLHFADDPRAVLAEARRVLEPGGRIVVIDLAAHQAEALRRDKGHRRLGFADEELLGWLAELGLVPDPPSRLDGPELAVVLWSARLPALTERDARTLERSIAA